MSAPSAPDEHHEPHGEAAYRPDSASIIHAVVTRRNPADTIKDRETQQRERIERSNLGLLLHALHDIADACIPPPQRRLVQESEVQRALTVLRRFFLVNPAVRLEDLLTHCEEATARDRNPMAHLVDPFQLRHVLTWASAVPQESWSAEDLATLERMVEHSPAAEISALFARIGKEWVQFPKSAPANLRAVFARTSRIFAPPANLEVLAFETAVITVRVQGVVGFADTRLFFALLKQIGGASLPGVDDFLQSDEINHATTLHRGFGNTAAGDYFRKLAHGFDHHKLPALEKHLFETVEARTAPPPPPPEPAAPQPEQPPAQEPRRGLLSGLRNLSQSIVPRK